MLKRLPIVFGFNLQVKEPAEKVKVFKAQDANKDQFYVAQIYGTGCYDPNKEWRYICVEGVTCYLSNARRYRTPEDALLAAKVVLENKEFRDRAALVEIVSEVTTK